MQGKANQSKRREIVISVSLITLATIVAYGFMIPKLGFYRDDWYMIWSAQAQGPQGVIDLFSIDRPLNGFLYALAYTFLGKSALNWQIYALIVKLAGGLAFFWLLRLLWPRRRTEATFATLLYLLYPGFYEQPNAALFINLLISHAAATLSLALTVYALKLKKRPLQIVAVLVAILLGLLYLIIYEAMIGLEAVRLMLVWYVTYQQDPAQKWKAGLGTALKRAIPYLVLAFGFLYWRLFIYQSTRRATSVAVLLGGYSQAPVHAALTILIETVKDFFDTTIFAWTVPLSQSLTASAYRDLAESVLLAGIVIGLAFAYYIWTKRQNSLDTNPAETQEAPSHMLLLGALAVLVTGFPIVAAGRDVSFSFQWDRYTVQGILGVALFMTGFAFDYVRSPARWFFLFALLVSGVMTQFQSAVYYRDLWTQTRELWWQLSWRAPGLQPGTTLIAAPPPGFRFLEEYEVWGPLNIIYNPGGPLEFSGQVPFDGIEADLANGTVETRKMRSVSVPRDYSTSLLVTKPTINSCAHVIDRGRPEFPPEEEARIQAIAPYSNTDLILTDATPARPPTDVFGREPQHDWCYYYEKIDLARQTGDWAAAAQLADEALAKGYAAADRSEWLPLIEAYVNVGETDKAKPLAQKIRAEKPLRDTLCDQLKGTTAWPPSTDPATVITLVCGNN
jgi:hypothetical protein